MTITRESLNALPGGMNLGVYDTKGRKWTVLYREIKNSRVLVCLKPPVDSGYFREMTVSYSRGRIYHCLIGPHEVELVSEIGELCGEACLADSVPEKIAMYICRWKNEAHQISYSG